MIEALKLLAYFVWALFRPRAQLEAENAALGAVVLTRSEEKQIGDFSGAGLRRLTRPLAKSVYRYTDGAGLVGIVKDQRMRASHIAFMNDASELRHSIQAMRDVIAARISVCTDPNTVGFLQNLDRTLDAPLQDPTNMAQIWVACFSEHRDQLSQWRGYGGADAGYAIEFDAIQLAQAGQPHNVVLLPCEYDQSVYGPIVANAVQLLEQLYIAGHGRFARTDQPTFGELLINRMMNNLSWLAPMIKHHAFHEEAEWRAYTRIDDHDVTRITFAPRRSNISGYIEFDLRSPAAGGKVLLPITGVVIGPSRNRLLSRTATRAMLTKAGYPIDLPVTFSEAPFRTD
jgi:Protein of unknown function (DUF2971)